MILFFQRYFCSNRNLVEFSENFERLDITDLTDINDKLKTEIKCRTIRIGSMKYESTEPVSF